MFATRTPEGDFIARPRTVILNCIAWSILLPLIFVGGWFLLPPDVRVLFTGLQIFTLLFFLAFILGFLWTVGLSYVRADAEGLTFRNGLRTHRRSWAQVRGIRYGEGDSWAFVLLKGRLDRLALMGIMRTDARRADELVAELRAIHAQHAAD